MKRQRVFTSYKDSQSSSCSNTNKTNNSARIVTKATLNLVEFYSCVNPTGFQYDSRRNPKRCLTTVTDPPISTSYPHDNAENDLIVHVNDVLGKSYTVIDSLGKGTFGHVYTCKKNSSSTPVAIKVIKNHPAYYNQALVEIQVCKTLKTHRNVVNFHHAFHHKRHLCLVFEQCSVDLYALLESSNLRGISLKLVRGLCKQMLSALVTLSDADIIHADLKPENIVLAGESRRFSTDTNESVPLMKLIDFGSATFEDEQLYSYIQSRFYRSPEVLLRLRYDTSIDIWSLGCTAAEMFLGTPLFPGKSDYDQLCLIVKGIFKEDIVHDEFTIPVEMIESTPNTISKVSFVTQKTSSSREYVLKLQSNDSNDNRKSMEDIVRAKVSTMTTGSEIKDKVECFIHFLKGILVFDPKKRWSARQAMCHPFITGKPLSSYVRPRDSLKKRHVVNTNTTNTMYINTATSNSFPEQRSNNNNNDMYYYEDDYYGHSSSYSPYNLCMNNNNSGMYNNVSPYGSPFNTSTASHNSNFNSSPYGSPYGGSNNSSSSLYYSTSPYGSSYGSSPYTTMSYNGGLNNGSIDNSSYYSHQPPLPPPHPSQHSLVDDFGMVDIPPFFSQQGISGSSPIASSANNNSLAYLPQDPYSSTYQAAVVPSQYQSDPGSCHKNRFTSPKQRRKNNASASRRGGKSSSLRKHVMKKNNGGHYNNNAVVQQQNVGGGAVAASAQLPPMPPPSPGFGSSSCSLRSQNVDDSDPFFALEFENSLSISQ